MSSCLSRFPSNSRKRRLISREHRETFTHGVYGVRSALTPHKPRPLGRCVAGCPVDCRYRTADRCQMYHGHFGQWSEFGPHLSRSVNVGRCFFVKHDLCNPGEKLSHETVRDLWTA